MTSKQTKSADWSDWQALQRQYLDGWMELGRQAAGQIKQGTPWHEGLELWTRLYRRDDHPGSNVVEKLLAQGKNYMGLLQHAYQAAASQGGGIDFNAFGKQWAQQLAQMGMPQMGENPFAKWAQAAGLGAMGSMGQFGDLGSMMQGLPAQMRAMFDPEALAGMSGPFTAELKAMFATPAFGYAREHQERQQKLGSAMVDLSQSMNRYNAIMAKSWALGIDLFESKLAERDEPGRKLDSLRAVYDLFVDAAEEAYAQIALSDEFRSVYGELVNDQMRVRQLVQQQVEQAQSQLGMPTRSELDGVHRKLADVRRTLRQQGAAGDIAAELAELRAEVAELKRALKAQVKAKTEEPAKSTSTNKRKG